MADVMLGKLPARTDLRTLKLREYLCGAKLPAAPDRADWSRKVVEWGMMLNDRLGCCTCSALGHMVQTWTANELSKQRTPTDKQVERLYRLASGYDGTPQTDRGAYMLDALKAMRKSGLGGHRIEAFAQINPLSATEIRFAIWGLGGAYLGLQLPNDALDDWEQGWTETGGRPNPWNGHAVNLVGYDSDTLRVVTWGKVISMSWPFLRKYCDEAYVLLTPWDWAHDGKCPAGLYIEELRQDLERITKD